MGEFHTLHIPSSNKEAAIGQAEEPHVVIKRPAISCWAIKERVGTVVKGEHHGNAAWHGKKGSSVGKEPILKPDRVASAAAGITGTGTWFIGWSNGRVRWGWSSNHLA
ncbi:MAG: hypothetical protein A3G87_00335 [Omnitrophica bacterium RIFCSPLOWO2_12_FULL_50_11]|nr:MAG: hypothetical protein A3G87_00335 [Omnitrophica bacterium RIFCSPLOWO2_12_FULL_50_11]